MASSRVGWRLPASRRPGVLLMLANAALPMAVITLWYAAASISLAARRPAADVATLERTPARSTAAAYA